MKLIIIIKLSYAAKKHDLFSKKHVFKTRSTLFDRNHTFNLNQQKNRFAAAVRRDENIRQRYTFQIASQFTKTSHRKKFRRINK